MILIGQVPAVGSPGVFVKDAWCFCFNLFGFGGRRKGKMKKKTKNSSIDLHQTY